MTYQRTPNTPKGTLSNALHFLSAQEMQEATGKAEATLRRISNPNRTDNVSIEVAAQLGAALRLKGMHDPFLALYIEIQERALGGKIPPAQCLQGLANNVTREVSEAQAITVKLIEDGNNCPHLRRNVVKEVEEARDALNGLLDLLSNNQAPKLRAVE